MKKFLGLILVLIGAVILLIPYVPGYFGYDCVYISLTTTSLINKEDLCLVSDEGEIIAGDVVYFKQKELYNTVGVVSGVTDEGYEMENMSEVISPDYMLGKVEYVISDFHSIPVGDLWLEINDLSGKILAGIFIVGGILLFLMPSKKRKQRTKGSLLQERIRTY